MTKRPTKQEYNPVDGEARYNMRNVIRNDGIVEGDLPSRDAKHGDVLKVREVEYEGASFRLTYVNPFFWTCPAHPELGAFTSIEAFVANLAKRKERKTDANT